MSNRLAAHVACVGLTVGCAVSSRSPDDASRVEATGGAGMSAEALVLAAPDVIVVPARGLQPVGGVDGLLEAAGIAETPAGRVGRVLADDDQFLLGNGPRTGVFLDHFVTDLHDDAD